MRQVVRSLLLGSLVVCIAYGLHTLANKHWLYAFYCWLGLLVTLFLLWLLRNYEAAQMHPDDEERRKLMEQELLENGFGSPHF